MKPSLFHHFFVGVCVLAFGVHQVSQKILGFRFDFADAYADPFLGTLIVLYLHQINPLRFWEVTRFELVVTGVVFMCVSELVFPVLAPHRFIADWKDLIGIFLGTATYLVIASAPKTKITHSKDELFKTN